MDREHPEHAPAEAPVTEPPAGPRISVLEWLVGIGEAAARKLRSAPPSPLVRIYER